MIIYQNISADISKAKLHMPFGDGKLGNEYINPG